RFAECGPSAMRFAKTAATFAGWPTTNAEVFCAETKPCDEPSNPAGRGAPAHSPDQRTPQAAVAAGRGHEGSAHFEKSRFERARFIARDRRRPVAGVEDFVDGALAALRQALSAAVRARSDPGARPAVPAHHCGRHRGGKLSGAQEQDLRAPVESFA